MKRNDKTDSMLREARERFDRAHDAESNMRLDMIDDLRFKNGDQWDESTRAQREAEDRPCLTVNRLNQFHRLVMGNIRQNSPSMKVMPVDSGDDVEVAELLEDLIRQIEHESRAKQAYMWAADRQVACGYGAFRVVNETASDDVFEQVLRIKRIRNPFTVYFDPDAQELTRQDAKFCFVTETISKTEFEARWPDATVSDFSGSETGETYERWYTQDSVRVAEYWRKVPVTKTLWLLSDGRTVDADKLTEEDFYAVQNGLLQVVREREAKSHKVMYSKIAGGEELEKAKEWPGRYIPIIPVYGEEEDIEGVTTYKGIIRDAKDPQRLYNYWNTTNAELIALQPRAPYLITQKQLEGHKGWWKLAGKTNVPYLPYNPDPQAPGAPQRQPPPQISTAVIQMQAQSQDDMKASTGIYDSALGNASNETSGRAILARQAQTDTGTFVYMDNLAAAIEHCGRILVDLIPHIYDTQRIVRVRGEDGEEKAVPVNQPVMTQQGPQILHDLTRGKYDVRIVVGPSYATKRAEAAESMIQFIQAIPGAGAISGDLIAKNMDWPGADQFAERLKKLLPPGMDEDAPPQQPDPMQKQMAMLQMALQEAELQLKRAEAEDKIADAMESRADAAKKMAEAAKESMDLEAMQLAYRQLMAVLPPGMQPQAPPQGGTQNPPSAGFFMPSP